MPETIETNKKEEKQENPFARCVPMPHYLGDYQFRGLFKAPFVLDDRIEYSVLGKAVELAEPVANVLDFYGEDVDASKVRWNGTDLFLQDARDILYHKLFVVTESDVPEYPAGVIMERNEKEKVDAEHEGMKIQAGAVALEAIAKLYGVPFSPIRYLPLVKLTNTGDGSVNDDLGYLYYRVLMRSERLKRLVEIGAPAIILYNERRMLQEYADALICNGLRGLATCRRDDHSVCISLMDAFGKTDGGSPVLKDRLARFNTATAYAKWREENPEADPEEFFGKEGA